MFTCAVVDRHGGPRQLQDDAGGQLWEVPLDGGAPTALTAVNSGQEDDPGFGGDIGDGVA